MRAKATPAGFARFASGGRWQLAPHLALLNRLLLEVAAGRLKRLIISMPPRHGKSQLASRYFPAWLLGNFPHRWVMLASYAAEVAAQHGRHVRDLLEAFGARLFGVRLRRDSAAAHRWQLENAQGGMLTAGVGGPLTGLGAWCLIIDDPVKNAEQAHSRTYREKVWEWYQSTAYTRLEPDGVIVLIMTRWHEEDLAGRLLKEAEKGAEPWKLLKLQAIATEDTPDPLGRKPGEALWQQRFNRGRLLEIKRAIGSYWWSALYQQEPAPSEGGLLKREWFQNRYRTLPSAIRRRVITVDSAYKDGVASDYSALSVWLATETHFYLLEAWRDRVLYPDLKAKIVDFATHYPRFTLLIEDKASGQALIQELKRTTHLPVLAYNPGAISKAQRVDLVAPLFEAGRVLLPESAPWLDEWIEEHVRFPNAAHDDFVDCTTSALLYLDRASPQKAEAPILIG